MVPAVLWNLAAWALWGSFILWLRYAIERRRQRLDPGDTAAVELQGAPQPILEVR
jgi:heme exporter protein C